MDLLGRSSNQQLDRSPARMPAAPAARSPRFLIIKLLPMNAELLMASTRPIVSCCTISVCWPTAREAQLCLVLEYLYTFPARYLMHDVAVDRGSSCSRTDVN